MRTETLATLAAAFLLAPTTGRGQPPAGEPGTKPPPDETRAIVREIEEAYKAPSEVDEDVRDELRKQYRGPTPEREAKLFYEIRRLYQTTPDQEDGIRRELQAAYRLQTPAQEAKLFAEIRRNGRLPLGTVHPASRAEQANKLFRRLDRDENGRLGPDELPADLAGQLARWDRDRNGTIDADEYTAYFLSRHEAVADAVAAGDIPLRLPKGIAGPDAPGANRRAPAGGAGKLPPGLPGWFTGFDADEDGQVGLYEWRRNKKPIPELVAMDGNADGLLEPREVLAYLAAQPGAARPTSKPPTPGGPGR